MFQQAGQTPTVLKSRVPVLRTRIMARPSATASLRCNDTAQAAVRASQLDTGEALSYTY